MFNKNVYYNYSKILEILSMVKFVILILAFIFFGYLIGLYLIKNLILGIILGIVIGIIFTYITYLKEQIKVEEMRMMLEIHEKLLKK